MPSTKERFALIGAGPMGLAAARNLQRFEAHSGGGLWDIDNPQSTVYESANLISSKRMTEFFGPGEAAAARRAQEVNFFSALHCTEATSSIATGIHTGQRVDGEPAPPVGSEDTPEAVAELIFRAAEADRQLLTTATTGRDAYWLYRLSPRLYEHLMRREQERDG